MTIHLPNDVERSIEAFVQSGRFASIDDAMAEAARLLLRELNQKPQGTLSGIKTDPGPDPILGLMRDDTELMDDIVADAYRNRREDKWRELDL